jgi:GntR family transcriptional regulator
MHAQIANVLRDRIVFGVYPDGLLLPPEILLCAEFKCSRHTIREAMKTLVNERLIRRRAGHGTIASPKGAASEAWGVRSINDLIGEFTDSQIVLLKRGPVSARVASAAAELFGLRANGSLYAIQRVITLKQGPTAHHRLYTLPKYAARIPKELLGHDTLIGQIERFCKVRAFRTRQVASAIEADGDDAKILGVRKGAPMLKLRRTYLDRDDAPIEYTELVCRPDRYEQTVDFYRDAPAGAGDRKAS